MFKLIRYARGTQLCFIESEKNSTYTVRRYNALRGYWRDTTSKIKVSDPRWIKELTPREAIMIVAESMQKMNDYLKRQMDHREHHETYYTIVKNTVIKVPKKRMVGRQRSN
jgi:hypothetical protein